MLLFYMETAVHKIHHISSLLLSHFTDQSSLFFKHQSTHIFRYLLTSVPTSVITLPFVAWGLITSELELYTTFRSLSKGCSPTNERFHPCSLVWWLVLTTWIAYLSLKFRNWLRISNHPIHPCNLFQRENWTRLVGHLLLINTFSLRANL